MSFDGLRGRAAGRTGSAVRLLGWAVLAVAGIGLLWIVVTAVLARSRLNAVRAELPQLRSALSQGRFADAQALAHRIEDQADSARGLTSGPAWWVGANVPWAGSPLQTGRVVAAETDRVAELVVPGVVDLSHGLSSGKLVTRGRVDLATLDRLAPTLTSAARAAQQAVTRVQASPSSWLSPVARAREQIVDDLGRLSGELTGADRTVKVLLPMLGRDTTQRYFVGFLNEAEARGVGGIPGAFAIVTVDHGKVTFTHFGSDVELAHARAHASPGPGFTARYRQADPQGVIANSDISPQFSYAARIWAGMWQDRSGERIDGAIAVDPTALSYLLRVTGPADLAGGGTVSADNVVALTQQQQYAIHPGDGRQANLDRKKYLTGIARSISTRVVAGGDPAQLVRALTHAAKERRLVVWSAHASIERQLNAADWSGSVQPAVGTRAGYTVVNAAGSKLDYYLDRSLTWTQTNCGSSGGLVAALRLHNDAPTRGLPPYVTYRADKQRGTKAGDNRVLVSFYAPAGARITQVAVDGHPVRFGLQAEAGSVVTTVDLELPRQAARTVTVTAVGPELRNTKILQQPMVRPLQVTAAQHRCG